METYIGINRGLYGYASEVEIICAFPTFDECKNCMDDKINITYDGSFAIEKREATNLLKKWSFDYRKSEWKEVQLKNE